MFWFIAGWYIIVAFFLVRRFSPEIYDVIIVKMTSVWYDAVLKRLDNKARVLDIGIGTGTALAKNADLVRDKELSLVGVDYEAAYVKKCENVIQETPGLAGRVFVLCKSVYDEDLLQASNKIAGAAADELFDAVYFSGSISLMPDPAEALRYSATLLKPTGQVYITHTFQRKGTRLFGMIKPLLKYVTTIDFGRLTYEQEVDQICADSGLDTVYKDVIPGSLDNYFQAAFLIILKKKKA